MGVGTGIRSSAAFSKLLYRISPDLARKLIAFQWPFQPDHRRTITPDFRPCFLAFKRKSHCISDNFIHAALHSDPLRSIMWRCLEEASSWTELKRGRAETLKGGCWALSWGIGQACICSMLGVHWFAGWAGLTAQSQSCTKGPLRQDLFLATLSPLGRKVSSSFSVSELGSSGLSSHRPLVNYHNSWHPEYFAFVQQTETLHHFTLTQKFWKQFPHEQNPFPGNLDLLSDFRLAHEHFPGKWSRNPMVNKRNLNLPQTLYLKWLLHLILHPLARKPAGRNNLISTLSQEK